jgi:hypothetical protein
VAELKHRRDTLDPFALSGTIQAKLEHIFQLSAEAARNPIQHSQLAQVSTGFHRKKKVFHDRCRSQRRMKISSRRSRVAMDGVRTQVVCSVGPTSPQKSLTGRPGGTTNCGHLAPRDEHAKEILHQEGFLRT